MTTTTHPAGHPSTPDVGEPAWADEGAKRPGRGARLLRGRPDDPAWARPALLALLGVTAVLYLWDLGASGWGNSFYSAAVQAGSRNWEAFFFGSSDAANSITVDKPPASLWVMELSVRMFGLSSWSILVPQALMGVATTGVVYAAVRRYTSAAAGLLAGAVMALTPVAALMFRYNNPDAMLVLVLTVGAYAALRAVEHASTRWLLLAGALVGLGFLTKQLQAMLVLPAFGVTYLIAAPTRLSRRIGDLALATGAMLVTLGWWVAIVELTPARFRPYIGGSQTNSELELAFGYNGLGRLTGSETGSVTGGRGGAAGGNMWGPTGITRLFDGAAGGQVTWLIPGALILLAGGLWLTRRAPRTDLIRAALLLWGGLLIVSVLVFSYMKGIYHDYYTIALAPALGGLVGTGAWIAWRRRREPLAAITLGAATAITAVWSFALLGRSADWHPWLRWVVLAVGLVSGAGMFLAGELPPRLRRGVVAGAVAASLAGPVGYTLNTVTTPHAGAIITAGPRVVGAGFGPGGFRAGFRGNLQGQGGLGRGFVPGQGGQGQGGQGQGQGGNGFQGFGPGFQGGPPGGFGAQGGGRGGFGGLLEGSAPSSQLVALLQANASSYTWVAATVGANNAAGYQLATQDPVMPIGGFNGSDPSPTLAQFQQYVAEGKIHYFIAGGFGGRANGGSDVGQQIASWVEQNFTATTVGNVTLYDLSGGSGTTTF